MSEIRESVEKIDLNLSYAFEHHINIKARVIQIVGEIDEKVFRLVDTGITELERHGKKQITIRINSEGGSVVDALAVVGRIRSAKSKIITEAYGACQSAATLILASGHKRRISEFCLFMHHEASYEADGRHSSIKAEVKEMERQEKVWAEFMSRFSNKSAEFYLNNGNGTDTYWTPLEVLEFGIVDEVIV
jgi:ATP-dependent protease ClpP protease subunit